MSMTFRTALATLLAALLLVPGHGIAQAGKSGAAQACADADLAVAGDNLPRIRAAVVCLHNQIRARHDLPALRENKRLRKAARRHSRDMVADRYFAHTTPEGVTMVDRILHAGYVDKDDSWVLGENLAWGTGSLGTPRGAVDAWMASPTHRANVLKKTYRELGVGISVGVPVSDAAGATYTVDFGVRR
jgi:uncharacterized protein YkwD